MIVIKTEVFSFFAIYEILLEFTKRDIMKEFDQLIEIANQLNDPKTGCPWDIKQSFQTLKKYILEEACELIDAVDEDVTEDIIEELGDYLYVVIFYAKVAQRDNRFTIQDVLSHIKEKLIRRHPHVFGEVKCKNTKEVEVLWNEVKAKEKSHRKSVLDGIPHSLLALARAQKVLAKLIDQECDLIQKAIPKKLSEEELGSKFIDLILQAEADGIDAENCLRKAIKSYEKSFRSWELENSN